MYRWPKVWTQTDCAGAAAFPLARQQVAGQFYGYPQSKTLLSNEEIAWHSFSLRR